MPDDKQLARFQSPSLPSAEELTMFEKMAEKLNGSAFIPKALMPKNVPTGMQATPENFARLAAANALGAMLKGREMGFAPMESLTSCWASPDGSLRMYSGTMMALMLKRGFIVRWEHIGPDYAELYAKRPDTGAEITRKWSIEDTQRFHGGIKADSNWAKDPEDMNVARAISRVFRSIATDITGGPVYDPGEVTEIDNANNNGQQGAIEASYTIGEKPAPAATSQPAAATSESRREPEPQPESKSEAPAPVAAPVTTQQAQPAAADDDRAQYTARMRTILVSPNWGITKAEMDQVFFGYFGVDKKTALPSAPKTYLALLDDILKFLGEKGPELLKSDPVKFGQSRKMAMEGKPAPAEPVDPIAAMFASVKAAWDWNDDLCAIAARLLVTRGATPESLRELIASSMPKFTEPMLETAFLIGYYDGDAMTAMLANAAATKMPLSWYQFEIEKRLGAKLVTFECATEKVTEAALAVIAANGAK